MSGWTDFPLSPLGRRQAEALERRLAAAPRAAALYSSPLVRARDTAGPLAGLAGPMSLAGDLREIDCGWVDGLPISEVRRTYAALWEENLRQQDDGFRWPGGESYLELRVRCLAAAGRIAAAHLGERVWVVTHAGVISQIVGFLHGTAAARWELFRPGHCSLTEIRWRGSGGSVLAFDDRRHVAELQG